MLFLFMFCFHCGRTQKNTLFPTHCIQTHFHGLSVRLQSQNKKQTSASCYVSTDNYNFYKKIIIRWIRTPKYHQIQGKNVSSRPTKVIIDILVHAFIHWPAKSEVWQYWWSYWIKCQMFKWAKKNWLNLISI